MLGPIPLPLLVFLIALALAVGLIYTSKFETPPAYYKTYCSCLGFVVVRDSLFNYPVTSA